MKARVEVTRTATSTQTIEVVIPDKELKGLRKSIVREMFKRKAEDMATNVVFDDDDAEYTAYSCEIQE